jgi:WD domain, G-beta repeat.
LKILKYPENTEYFSFEGYNSIIRSIEFTQDSKLLLSVGEDKQLKIFSVSEKAEIASYSFAGIIYDIKLSIDQRHLILIEGKIIKI